MDIAYKLDVAWCRTFQAVLKIGNYFMGYRMPKYLEGPGRIQDLGVFLRERAVNDVLVVTGSSARAAVGDMNAPVDAVVAGIIDKLQF